MKDKCFSVEVSSDYSQWWRYNVYISLVCYNSDNEVIDYCNLIDSIYEIERGNEHRTNPADYPDNRSIQQQSSPCDHVALYLYVIANTFTESTVIRDSPEFLVDLIIRCDSVVLRKEQYSVNQLGGMTIAGELITA